MSFYRWLSGFLMLRPGEGRHVAFLALIAALAGFGLAIGRASSDALFFKRYGVDHLPQMYVLIALVLVPASLTYAAFVDRLTTHRMFMHMLVGFGIVMGVSWFGMFSEMGNAGIALYFIAYGVISELLLTHFSVYASSFFDTQQAKRLLPSVMATSRLGATFGGIFLGVVGSGMATEHAALLWMTCLVLALILVGWRHHGEPSHTLIRRGQASSPIQMLREGLMFSRQSALMRVTALGMFLLVLLLSVQEYLVGKIFVRHYPNERELAAFFGWFLAILNASVLVFQLFMSSRLIRRFGLKAMNLVYPVSTLLTFGLLTLSTGSHGADQYRRHAARFPQYSRQLLLSGLARLHARPCASLAHGPDPAARTAGCGTVSLADAGWRPAGMGGGRRNGFRGCAAVGQAAKKRGLWREPDGTGRSIRVCRGSGQGC
jgi:ATP/ADP translocase